MIRPKLFIGSSSEGIDVARAVEQHLEREAEITIWAHGVFGLGEGTLESLVKALDEYDFAAFVLTPDDLVTSRETTKQSPRDNILLELGMFIGHIGRERTFVIYNRDSDIKLPSDLAGVTMATFGDRQDRKLISALSSPCTKIINAIRNLWISSSTSTRQETDANYAFEDDFTNGLDAWATPSTWLPELTERGLHLIPHEDLAHVLLLQKLDSFSNGVIECEVCLDQGALFNIVFRGGLADAESYMARLDTRRKWPDCILFRSKAAPWWQECNFGKGTLTHHSPHRQRILMRIEANRNRVSLFRDEQIVDMIEEAYLPVGRIGLFAELSGVYVRRIRIRTTCA